MPRCRVCKKQRRTTDFAIKRGATRNKECKQCKRNYNKIWYRRNRKKHILAARSNSVRYRQAFRALMETAKNVPCTDCGHKYKPWIMEFDHLGREPKLFTIGRFSPTASLENVKAEIAKCEVVCANCHRDRTHKRRPTSRTLNSAF